MNNIENWSEKKLKRRTFYSFASFGLAATVGIFGYKWYRGLPFDDNGLSSATRKVLNFNEKINKFFFSNHHLVQTFDKSKAVLVPRTNGDVGMDTELDANTWKLKVYNPAKKETIYVGIEEIKALPKQEITFDFKCIEGWTEIVNYGGAKLSDFFEKFGLGEKLNNEAFYKYVGMETPDGTYFVGLDMASAMHPQTILCYELNGQALPDEHGAPLRLIIPVKYGVKNLKRIGTISFSDERPRDYWHEDGYDYDAAL